MSIDILEMSVSELQNALRETPADKAGCRERLIRSMQQSLRVDGYDFTSEEIEYALDHVEYSPNL